MLRDQAKLNADIIDSNIFNQWGGECINKTGGDTPVGIGVLNGEENIFGYNDAFDVSGYMYTNNLSPENGAYKKEMIINIFQKKENEIMDSYQSAIDLHSYLTKRKFDCSIALNKSVKCEFCYFATVTVSLTVYPNC